MPRNSSGNYTLPAGNPVVANTLIETAWANPTLADVGAALTDSLDRYGRGSMLAQLLLASGTVAAPAFAFSAETTSGLFRETPNVIAMSVQGVTRQRWSAAGVEFVGNISASGTTPWVLKAGDTMTGRLTLNLNAAGDPVPLIVGSTHAASTYMQIIQGGVPRGYLGSGVNVFNFGSVSDFGIASQGRLMFGGPSGAVSGYFSAGGTLVVGDGSETAISALTVKQWVSSPTPGIALGVNNNDGATNRRIAMFADSPAGLVGWDISGSSSPLGYVWRVVGAEKMRLLNTGDLSLGMTTSLGAAANRTVLSVNGPTAAMLAFGVAGVRTGYVITLGADTAYAADANMLLYTNGVERARIDAAGNVGIGTTAPQVRLHVNAGPIVTDQGAFLNTKTSSAGIAWSAQPTLPSLILNGPASGGRPEISFYRGSNTVPEFSIRQHTTSGQGGQILVSDGVAVPTLAQDITRTAQAFYTAGIERMQIAADGNVVIAGGAGSWAPSSAPGSVNIGSSGAINAHVTTYHDNTGITIGAGVTQKSGITIQGQGHAGGNMIFMRTGNAERMRIDSTGNVGIGTSTPQSTLSVGNSDATAVITPGNTNGHITLASVGASGAVILRTNSAERARIDAAGVFTYGGIEVGYRSVPRIDYAVSSNASINDRGKMHAIAASGSSVTIASGVFSPGDCISIVNFYNNTSTIVQGSGVTLRLGALTGNRSLGPYGICTIWFASAGECWISGVGVS